MNGSSLDLSFAPRGAGLNPVCDNHKAFDHRISRDARCKNKKDSRGTLSLIALFPSLQASRKKSISFISGSTSGIPLYFRENVADFLSKLGPVQLLVWLELFATSQSWKSILQGLEVLKDELIFFPGNCRFNQALNYYLWLRSRKVWVGRIMLGKLDPLSLLPPIPLKVIWMKLALGPPPGRVLRFLTLKDCLISQGNFFLKAPLLQDHIGGQKKHGKTSSFDEKVLSFIPSQKRTEAPNPQSELPGSVSYSHSLGKYIVTSWPPFAFILAGTSSSSPAITKALIKPILPDILLLNNPLLSMVLQLLPFLPLKSLKLLPVSIQPSLQSYRMDGPFVTAIRDHINAP
ncbi:hypothetical protein Tco_1337100 [Tanacetum coccineum]